MSGSILFFTSKGEQVAREINGIKGAWTVLFDKEQRKKESVQKRFDVDEVLVFVGAVGIAVRYISGLPKSKETDPAVLVVDEKKQFVIPILSGHLGGANELAMELADKLGAVPVITTATDLRGLFAIDHWTRKNGCVIDNIEGIKNVSSALLRGETVGVLSDFRVQGALPCGLCLAERGAVGICFSYSAHKKPFDATLNVLPQNAVLGVGCRKGTPPHVFESSVASILCEREISLRSIRALASIDIKKNEPCINAFAEKHGLPFVTYSAEELARAPGAFTPSHFVLNTVGVDNVCERSAWMASGGPFLIRKQACRGVTVAVSAPEWSVDFGNNDGLD